MISIFLSICCRQFFKDPFNQKSGTPLDNLIKEMSLLTLENLKVTTSKEQLFAAHQTTTKQSHYT